MKNDPPTAEFVQHAPKRDASAAQAVAPLRIVFDTSQLGSSSKDCETVGATVTLQGTSGSVIYTCTQADILTDAKRAHINDRILRAVNTFWSTALSPLSPVVGRLKISRDTCGPDGGATVPASYKTTGVTDADIVVFVTSWPIVDASSTAGTSSTTLAWAAHCAVDATNGRPIAGQINFAPKNVITDEASLSSQIATGVHEMAHILAFSSNFWDAMWDPIKLKTRASVVQTGFLAWGKKTTSRIISPKVVATLASQFGCTTASGAELEDNGGSATAGSHWEKRLFPDDILSGSAAVRAVYSPMTLALFEDSGWYAVDYSNAESSLFGRNKGCDILDKSCKSWTGFGYELCDAAGTAASCSLGLVGYGPCIRTYTAALPTALSYYTDTKIGGSEESDFCSVPYLTKPYSNGLCNNVTVNTVVSAGGVNTAAARGELYGERSRCFMSSTLRAGVTMSPGGIQPGCYFLQCSGSVLSVRVGSTVVVCPTAGGSVAVTGAIPGTIICPPASEVCTTGLGACDGWNALATTTIFTGPPAAMAVRSATELVVASGAAQFAIYSTSSSAFTLTKTYAAPAGVTTIVGLAARGTLMYAAQASPAAILEINIESAQLVRTFTLSGLATGASPTSIAYAPLSAALAASGGFFYVGASNNVVYVFELSVAGSTDSTPVAKGSFTASESSTAQLGALSVYAGVLYCHFDGVDPAIVAFTDLAATGLPTTTETYTSPATAKASSVSAIAVAPVGTLVRFFIALSSEKVVRSYEFTSDNGLGCPVDTRSSPPSLPSPPPSTTSTPSSSTSGSIFDIFKKSAAPSLVGGGRTATLSLLLSAVLLLLVN